MRVLFDVVHPAQVHFFKNAAKILRNRGDKVLITAREKDVTVQLLEKLDLPCEVISRKKGSSVFSMAAELISRDIKLIRIAKRFKPDVMVARVGISAAFVAKLLAIPSVIFDDMETAWMQSSISLPFATYICTGLGYYRHFGKRHHRFKGSPVLAYLHENYFTPDPEPLIRAGLDPETGCTFIRLVSWGANHDFGKKAATTEQVESLIEKLTPYGRIVISSEQQLPRHLTEYASPLPPEQLHNLLAFANLAIVEGGTMAAEAAVLGVPVVCLNSYDFGYLRALENQYRLVTRPGSFAEALNIAQSLLARGDTKEVYRQRQRKMLEESEDVTRFQIDMIEKAAREHKKK